VKVDGKDVEYKLVGNAMIALDLTKGKHDIEFTYENKAFTYGALITSISVLTFLALVYCFDRQKWNERFVKIYKKIKRK
jgi:uncharacterized membrane protein YfhO